MTPEQALSSVFAIAFITLLTRAMPFFVFPANRPIPRYVKYLGNTLPFAVIGMLAVYCMRSASIAAFPHGLPEAIAILFIVIAHKWKHNLLISVLGGTALYMILVQTAFA